MDGVILITPITKDDPLRMRTIAHEHLKLVMLTFVLCRQAAGRVQRRAVTRARCTSSQAVEGSHTGHVGGILVLPNVANLPSRAPMASSSRPWFDRKPVVRPAGEAGCHGACPLQVPTQYFSVIALSWGRSSMHRPFSGVFHFGASLEQDAVSDPKQGLRQFASLHDDNLHDCVNGRMLDRMHAGQQPSADDDSPCTPDLCAVDGMLRSGCRYRAAVPATIAARRHALHDRASRVRCPGCVCHRGLPSCHSCQRRVGPSQNGRRCVVECSVHHNDVLSDRDCHRVPASTPVGACAPHGRGGDVGGAEHHRTHTLLLLSPPKAQFDATPERARCGAGCDGDRSPR